MNNKASIADMYPLSPMQQGLLFHSLYAPESGIYVEHLCCTLHTRLDVKAFISAWQQVVDRHPILRTGFYWKRSVEPFQVVYKSVLLPYSHLDWRGASPAEQEQRLMKWLREDRQRGFDLRQAPLMRLTLIELGEQQSQLVWTHHHLLLDGWSVPLLLEEVFALYEGGVRGEEVELERRRPYVEYIRWLAEQDQRAAEQYWRGALRGFRKPLRLGIERSAAIREEAAGAVGAEGAEGAGGEYQQAQERIGEAASTVLQRMVRTEQLTLNTLVQGAWAVLLSRYSGEADVVFGATVSGRSAGVAGIERMIGLFINTLPVRVEVRAAEEVGEWLRELQGRQVEMRQYEYSGLVEVQGWSEVERGERLFESLVVFENYPVEEGLGEQLGEQPVLDIRDVRSGIDRTNYPLMLMSEPGAEMVLRIVYDGRRYEEGAVERMAGHLRVLLESMAANPQQHLSHLSMLTPAEEHQLLVEWNDTHTAYPQQKGIHQLFAEQAALRPDAVAIVFQEQQISYRELNRRANQLAHYLRGKGVKEEVIVGILMERTIEMVIGLLGVLKAGGAYLPLDPEYPVERLQFMLKDAGAEVVVTQKAERWKVAEVEAQIVEIDEQWEEIERESEQNPETEVRGENLAYLIYTSGSTGTPKGVAGTHQASINRFTWMWEAYSFEGDEICCQKTSLSFVDSVWEIWGPLLRGVRSIIIPHEVMMNPARLVESLAAREVTRIVLVPSLLRVLLDSQDGLQSKLPKLKYWVTSGEALSLELARRFLELMPESILINLYGSSEVSADVTCYDTRNGLPLRSVPIGRPIANTQVYILGLHQQPVSIGLPGELYVGGANIARGYLKRPELTAERFITNPFSTEPGARLYRTGDLARYMEDGNIEFLGRIDRQVKIRGFRIEPREIESALAQNTSVKESVVLPVNAASGETQLVAYVVLNQEQVTTPADLRNYLKQHVPDYMVPSLYIILDTLPLTPSGKIDSKALPAPDSTLLSIQEGNVAPRTPSEEILAGIWSTVLKVEQFGVNDNFFGLGGHSLLATQITSRVREAFHVELPLRTLFENPTIAQLAARIQSIINTGHGPAAPSLRPASREHPLPLSFAQQRLWFIDQLEPGSSAYNIPTAVRLTGLLNLQALELTFTEIVRRHEVLRTSFVSPQGEPVQVVAPPHQMSLPLIDLRALSPTAQRTEAEQLSVREAEEGFDLSTGPLLRVKLLRLAADEYVLLLTMHHIISDGWSMGVLVREVATLYEAYCTGADSPLSELSIQYGDYAVWQREWLSGAVLAEQLEYWRAQLGGAPAVLELPSDRVRPAVQSYRGASQRVELGEELTSGLRQLSEQENVTLFMTLLGGFQTLLMRYTGQQDIVVGTPIAGRQQAEVEPLIGFFVNSLALRTSVKAEETVRELLRREREVCLGGYGHQEVPFEKLVEELRPERSLSYTPLFQVMLVLQNGPEQELHLRELELEEVGAGGGRHAKFDLTISLQERAGGINGIIEYSTELYEEERIRRLGGHLRVLLESMVANPQQHLSQLSLLTEAEEHQLLVEWNDTDTAYPQQKGIHQLFAEQAALRPDAVAVVFQEQQISYRELNQRANQLAHYLRGKGVGEEVIVGILMERTIEMVVGLLGVLKAGGAYLPLDPEYPVERLRWMIDDAGAEVVLTYRSERWKVAEADAQIVEIDEQWEEIERESEQNPETEVRGENLAYVIYTSGSTGIPKGVMVEHGNIVNVISDSKYRFDFDATDVMPMIAPFSFDISLFELITPLVTGATAALFTKQHILDIPKFAQSLYDVTLLHAVPSLMRQVVDFIQEKGTQSDYRNIRRIFIGGDIVPPGLVAEMREVFPHALIHILYGPTEGTIICSSYNVTVDCRIQDLIIGKPLSNVILRIYDKDRNLLPIGVPGEIYIGGAGVTRGYLKRQELTAEKYVTLNGQRFYRTGDLARYRSDGELEFIGRVDNQVKIRGYRIELAEIEAALASHPEVEQAVVVARQHQQAADENNGDKQLVAYLVARQTAAAPTVSELRQHLKQRLPAYMIPAHFLMLDQLPLTTNGKVDRQALPAPQQVERPQVDTLVAPRTAVEHSLAQIWSHLLKLPQVGIHDNFFELGGDSILSIQIVARARQAGLNLSPKLLFQHQSIAELAAACSPLSDAADAAVATPRASGSGLFPLTPIQHWFFSQELPHPHHFNQSTLLSLSPLVRPSWLSTAFSYLVDYHAALRLRFSHTAEGSWQQSYAPSTDSESARSGQAGWWSRVDLSRLTDAQRRTQIERIAQAAQESLHIEEGPVLRVVLFESGEGESGRLLVVIHHLAVDGVSWRILLEEMQELVRQQERGEEEVRLRAASSGYEEWAERIAEYGRGEEIEKQIEYWLSVVREEKEQEEEAERAEQAEAEAESRSVEQQREPQTAVAGAPGVERVSLTAELTHTLLTRAQAAYHTQINDLLLTALLRAWQRTFERPHLLIEMEGHGREDLFSDLDVTRTIGWFTTLYPVRLRLPERAAVGAAIKSIKEQLREVPERGIGYGVLRYEGREEVRERLRRGGRVEVRYNYLGQFDQVVGAEGYVGGASERRGAEHGGAVEGSQREHDGAERAAEGRQRHLMAVSGRVLGGQLEVEFSYHETAISTARARELAQSFEAQLHHIIHHCTRAGVAGFTPSDFPLAALTQVELERLTDGPQVEHIYPLSPMQQGLLFHSLYAPQRGEYVEQLCCRLQGHLDQHSFVRAWEQVLERHPILRTGFYWEQLEKPVQVVREQAQLPWQCLDWRSASPAEQEQRLSHWLREDRQRGFDLRQAPLMRLTLIELGEQQSQLVWTHHHLLLDGWSVPLLLEEVFALYEGGVRGEEVELERRRPYVEYIRWLAEQDQRAAEQYWRGALRGFRKPLRLGIERVGGASVEEPEREAVEQYGEAQERIGEAASTVLQRMVRTEQLTLNTLVQGAWAVLLSRYSGEADVVFGATVSGRSAGVAGIERMIGLFINTLPVRVEVRAAAEVGEWLRELQGRQVEMRQYEYSGLVEVQGWSEVERGERLFESLVVFENYPVEEGLGEHLSGGAGLGIGKVEIEERTNYPLMLMAGPGAELIMEIVYDGRRYEEGAIRRMGGHLRVLLEAMAANPHQRLSQLSMLTEAEEHQLLVEWNDTNTAYPQQECIHQLFEEQAALRPEAVAVVFQEQEMSYGELNRRANQLAHYLRGKGVTAEVIVAILMERSMEMVVGLLGVLKAGGAYLPLDPEYPVERLSLMLREGNVEVLVRQGEVVKGDELQCREIVEVDREWERISEESEENPINEVRGENLAYLIYTSGSTGIPKGVLVTHANVARLLSSTDQYFHFNHQDVWTLFHSYAFDFSVWEIWGALSYGGRLVVVPDWVRRSPSEFYQLLCSEQVTVLNQTPSAFYQLIQWEATLKERESELRPRVVIFGGEALDARRLHSWSAAQVEPRTQLVNMYGITETTVHVTYQQVGEAEMRGEAGSVVGRHLGDLQTYVLDESLGVVPVGVSGELYVGGAGLARGYLRHPELTAERFIPDPFSTEPGARLYRTGDLMKYRAGGELEFIGRVDHQVKMRGYRIELGEIEAVLRTHASVEQAVVVARQHQQAADENNGDKQLIAYVIARQEQEAPAISELRQHLKQRLPAYMIPAHFLMLDQFPLTANGKVDRQALPERNGEAGELQSTFVESRDVVESLLKRIWEEVLGVRPISMTDDFFELGGHSILAIHLMARIKETWGHEVPIFTLYQEKTIENLARIIRQQSELSQKPVVAFRSTGSRPPFFCVHPGGGQVHCYVDLAHHLGPEQPFYALQSPAIYDGHEPFKRIEPMAACYVEALRAIQPQGPYFLGGWSLGGNVAFEMAQQLFAQGQQVALLALIDSSVIDEVDDSVNPEKVNEIELSMSLPYWRDLPASAKELGMYEQLSCLIEMGKKNKIVPADFELSHAIRFAKVLHGNFLANLKYEPKPYAGRITLIRASDPSPERPQVVVPDDPTYGWGKVAANGIEIYDVSGYHEGLMGEPHVKSLAEQLMICINKARAV